MLFSKDNFIFIFKLCLFFLILSNTLFGMWDIKKGEKSQKLFHSISKLAKPEKQKMIEVGSSILFSFPMMKNHPLQ